MQLQDAGTWTSGSTGSCSRSAVARSAAMAITKKIILATSLSAACPGMLFATSQTNRVSPPKAPQTPPAAVVEPAASTATTTVTLNTLFFDFGNNLVGNKLTQTAVLVKNTGSAALTLKPALSGDASFTIVAAGSCGATLAAGKSCDVIVNYLPTKGSYPKGTTATLKLNFANAVAGTPEAVAITGVAAPRPVGRVTATRNPQVALYTMTLPFPGRVKVNFGPTTAYGFKTWLQGTDVDHGVVSIYVAGMKQKTTYHMSAAVTLSNGIAMNDVDHTFTTGTVDKALIFNVTASTGAGMKPQPGIELTNPLHSLEAYDLQGNLIWAYQAPLPLADSLDGAKLLPNGDILATIGPLSNAPLLGTIGTDSINEIREIDLAGDTIKELSVTDLNASLSTATCKECQDSPGVPLVLQTFHHDITPLPNGHWLILSNELRKLGPATKPPLTTTTGVVPVLGDVVVDVDENMQPVWVWNEFNHLDPNRQPMMFPDWTHSNAVLYSPDDGNFLISVRHQNWVIKVDYENGRGNGDMLWRLGSGGDLKLKNGTAPDDWNYAQHGPAFFSPNSSGVFSLGLMDNGDDRLFAARPACKPQGGLPAACLYSTIPIYEIDEKAKTATLTFHQKIASTYYSNFGGNIYALPNGNVEYDLCGLPNETGSLVQEVTHDAAPKTVWRMFVTDTNFYRSFRIPSLYPGVQW